MSDTWFNTRERITALQDSAKSWLKTPWAQNSRVKGAGGGVSCHYLPYEIVREAGYVFTFDPPKAPADWSINHRASLIEPFMDNCPEFVSLLPASDLSSDLRPLTSDSLPGDFNGYHVGGCVHHFSLVLTDGRMVHVLRHIGVIISRVDDPTFAKRLKRRWRLLP